MRLGFVVIALIFLASGEVLSATGPKISVAASANTPLQIRDELNNSSKKRFLRSKETTGDEEERKFQVQGLQKIIKKQQALSKALSKRFIEKELVVFKEWMRAGENPKTLSKLFGLNRNPLKRNDPNHLTWVKFSRYFKILQKQTKTM